jgi:hypothetical protein
MLFAKLLLALSVIAASKAFNIITPENQHHITGLIASLLTPEDKKRLLQVAFGHKNQDNGALRNDNAKWELSYSVSAFYLNMRLINSYKHWSQSNFNLYVCYLYR